MSINKFTSEVKQRGLARTNRYEVYHSFPPNINFDRGVARLANLFCDSVTLPGASIFTTPHKMFGETRELPYDKSYDPVTMSFYVDSGMKIKKVYESWMDLVFNPDTRTMGYYQDYTIPIEIYVKTIDDRNPYKVILYEAYPKSIASIELNTGSRDVMKMSLTLQYKYWKSSELDQTDAVAKQSPSIFSFVETVNSPVYNGGINPGEGGGGFGGDGGGGGGGGGGA